jgi:hypothetical protein
LKGKEHVIVLHLKTNVIRYLHELVNKPFLSDEI